MTNIEAFGRSDYAKQAISAVFKRVKAQSDFDIAVATHQSAELDLSATQHKNDADSSRTLTTEKNYIPDKWTSSGLYKIDTDSLKGYTVNETALDRVRKQLESEGIDADKRTPTHEITDEQVEWLSSRYDFDFLSACCFTHEEFGNFVLDLAYLNVFSLDEVKDLYGVMPFNANHKGYLYEMGVTSGSSGFVNTFGGIRDLISAEDLPAELLKEYLREKYTALPEEEYDRMAKEFADQRAERLRVIKDLFERIAANKGNGIDGVKPTVQNISEKLKEDFSGKM